MIVTIIVTMKILFIDPNANNVIDFRKELIFKLSNLHEVILVTEKTQRIIDVFSECDIQIINVKCNLTDKSLFSNLNLLFLYKKIIKQTKPNCILTYTIKPNLYVSLIKKKTYQIANITGLGQSFEKRGFLNSLVVFLYKLSFKNVEHIMFQNENIVQTFKKNNIDVNGFDVIPGSGVNLEKFKYKERIDDSKISFLYASRFIKSKGINLLISAIPIIIKKFYNANFILIGDYKKYRNELEELKNKHPNNFFYYDRVDNLMNFYKDCDFLVSPSFYKEGISNVLLEALAVGRPIITTSDNSGCKELLIEGLTGYGVKSNDLKSLICALEKACMTSKENINKMGLFGRKFVEEHFDRNLVIKKYIDLIKDIEIKKY